MSFLPCCKIFLRIRQRFRLLPLAAELDILLQSEGELEMILSEVSRALVLVRSKIQRVPTLVFLSVPLFSPHHARASAQLCLSARAEPILSHSWNKAISTWSCVLRRVSMNCSGRNSDWVKSLDVPRYSVPWHKRRQRTVYPSAKDNPPYICRGVDLSSWDCEFAHGSVVI